MNNILYNDNYLPIRRRPREYRRRLSMLLDTYPDEEIRERYRFNRENIAYICELLYDDLARETMRNQALSVSAIVQAGLRFLATNSFQQVVGDVVGIRRSTTCKVVHEFTEALCRHKGEFIVCPRDDEDRALIKKGFYELAGSTHDSFILNNSAANALFENLLTTVDKGIILGDSGYPL